MSLSYARDAILDSLYIRNGGLKLSDTNNEIPGTIRFNTSNNFFEGYTGEPGPLGETWRSLLLEMASPTVLGGIKVGTNLTITSGGVLSSVAAGVSRIYQNVITVSKNVGSADYTTINGAIDYINDLIISSNPNKPTHNNPFKIVVSPGIYEEHLTLPDYVSLEGEGSNVTVIRRLDGADIVEDGALIIMGESSRLENLELQHYESGGDYSAIVYANHKSNLIFSNLKIVMGDLLYGAGVNVYGLYFTDCDDPILDNLTINITKGTGDIYGLYFDPTNPIVFNTKITIDTNSNNSYGSYHLTNSNGEYRNCDLTVKNSINNIALKNVNSTPYLNNCNLIAEKDPLINPTTTTAYGIYNESNTFYKTLTNNNISFTSNLLTNERDVINLPTTSGFKKDYYIQVLGASSNKNNSLFMVEDITTTKLIVPINKLETQSASAGTTINQYYTLKVDYSFIKGTNSSLFNTSGNDYYVIKGEKSTFVGSQFDPLLSNSLFLINNYNSITVSTDGGDFRNLSTALNSIQNANEFNRYVIIVKSGIYTEPDDTFIEMKPYVNIIGSGRDTTIINFNKTGSHPNSSCAIFLSSNIEISDITFNNESQITSPDDNRTVMCGQNVSNVNLKKVGLNNVGAVQAQNIGLNLFGCTDETVILNDLKIVVNSVSNTNIGLDLISSNIEILGCDILINGSTATSIYNYGINSNECNLNITNTKITVNANDDLTNPDIRNICLNTQNDNTDDPTPNYLIQFFSCNFNIVGLLTNTNNYAIYTVDNYSIIGGNSNLYGNNYYNLDTLSKSVLKLNSCWGTQIVNNNLVYYPLSSGGVPMSSVNGNLFIGDNAGNIGVSGTDNTAVGVSSGTSLTSASSSTLLGSQSGNSITEGNSNTFIGYKVGNHTTTGDYNTFTGAQSGFSNVSGNSNCAYGMNSLYNTSGNNNSSIGYASGFHLTTGNDNTFLGTFSGHNSTTSSKNVFLGVDSGLDNTTGNNNVYVGYEAGTASSTSSNNVALGHLSGFNNIVNNNTFIGSQSGYNSVGGVGQTMIGYKSGYSDHYFTPTGNNNTLLGYKTGYLLTSGSGNLIAGSLAGYSLSSGSRNVILGSTIDIDGTNSSGYNLTEGNDDVIIGANAGSALTTGNNNILLGSSAGSSLLTGSSNVLIGLEAGKSLTTQFSNILIGNQVGKDNTNSGGNLIMIGDNAGSNSNVNNSILIGNDSGKNLNGNYNIGIGFSSLKNQSSGFGSATGNVFMGSHSGLNISTGNRSVGIGNGDGTYGVLSSQTNQSDNTAIGYLAGRIATSSENTLIGSKTGYNLTSGAYNSLLGFNAGYSLTTGEKNVLLGHQAGNLLSGNENTFIGYNAGSYAIGSSQSVCIGSESGHQNYSTGLISIGYKAGYINNTFNNYNIFIGYESGGNSSQTLNNNSVDNVFLGYQTGYSAFGAAKQNILIGSQAGLGLTQGQQNVLIGDKSGSNIGTGSQNIFIGANSVGLNSVNADSNIFIGAGSGNANISGDQNLYIGTEAGYSSTTTSKNISMGYQAGYNTTDGYENIYIGGQSGLNNVHGYNNICFGNRSGFGSLLGSYSNTILIGNDAGYSNLVDNSLFIGNEAGYNNTSGEKNINIGYQSGFTNQEGTNNINIGYQTGYNSTADNNIFIGPRTGYNNTTGFNNVLIGANAGETNSIGQNNIFMGTSAGNLTVSNNNIMIGAEAGLVNTDGTNNIFLGFRAGYHNTLAQNNIFLGNEAGSNVSGEFGGGNDNVFIGGLSGLGTTEGSGNVFLGYKSGFQNTIGNNNMCIGYQSAYNSLDGNNNLYFGYKTAYNSLGGDNNLAIGNYSQTLNFNSNQNMSIGNYSLYGNQYGKNNMVFGSNALLVGNVGDSNVVIGVENSRIVKNSNFTENIITGYKSNYQGFSSKKSIILGANSVLEGMGGESNIVIGSNNAKYLGDNITQLTLPEVIPPINTIGYNVIGLNFNPDTLASLVKKGQYLTIIYEDVNHIIIGEPQVVYVLDVTRYNSLYSNYDQVTISSNLIDNINIYLTKIYLLYSQTSSIIQSSIMGNTYFICKTPLTSFQEIFNINDKIVIQALNGVSISMMEYSYSYEQICSIVSFQLESGSEETGTTRVFIDAVIPHAFTEGDPIFLARIRDEQIGINDTSLASSNIIVGYNSCNDITLGSKNIAIGDNTLKSITTEKYNTAIGTSSGFSVKSDNNFLLGTKSGYYIDNVVSGSGQNTMIGYGAGYFAGFSDEASNNLYIGNRVGQINQGSNNIFIGNETETALSADVFGNSTYSNKLAIYKSYNGVPANPLIGGDLSENKIGICTIEPNSSLDINGSFGKSIENILQFTSTTDYSNTLIYPRYWDKKETLLSVENAIDLTNFRNISTALIDEEFITYNGIAAPAINNVVRNVVPQHHLKSSIIFDVGSVGNTALLSSYIPITGDISLSSTIDFNTTGITGLAIIDGEIIQYNGKDGGLGQAIRGIPTSYNPTTPISHSSGTTCYNIASSIPGTIYNSNLTVGINDIVDRIPVNFGSAMLPSPGNIIIGSEIIYYPDNTSYFFNVTRGTNSTISTSHAALDPFFLVSNSNTALIYSTLEEGISALAPTPFPTMEMVKVDNLRYFANEGYFILENEILQYTSIALIDTVRGSNHTSNTIHTINSPIILISDSTNDLIYNTLDQTINEAISIGSIILNDASGFTNTGFLLIGDEIFTYGTKTSNILTGINRAQQGTTSKPHLYGSNVYLIPNVVPSFIMPLLSQGTVNTLTPTETIVKFINRNSSYTNFTKQGTVLVNSELIKFNNTVLYDITRGIGNTVLNEHLVGVNCYNFTSNAIDPISSLQIKNSMDSITTDVTINLLDGRLPVSGTILINNELITYYNGLGLINVTRGYVSTTAATHYSGTIIYSIPSLGASHSTLKHSIQSDDTAIPVIDNSVYSSSGLILINSEIISYANKNTLDNVVRGLSNSKLASHLINSIVSNISIGSLPSYIGCIDIDGNYIIPSATINADKVILSDTTSGIRIIDSDDITTFPNSGSVQIDTENIFYATNKTITDITRETNSTVATTHSTNSLIFLIDTTVNTSLITNTLSIACSDNSTEITLNDASSFASNGLIIINSEIIKYTGKLYSTLTGCYRSSYGTVASLHIVGSTVYKCPLSNLLSNYLIQDMIISDRIIPFSKISVVDFGTQGTVLVGSEIMTFASKNALGCLTREYNSTNLNYYTDSKTVILKSFLLSELESTILVDTTNDNLFVDLPQSSTVKGRIYTIKKIATNNTVYFRPYLTEQIDDYATNPVSYSELYLTKKNSFIEIQSDGSNWKLLASNILVPSTSLYKDYMALSMFGTSLNNLFGPNTTEKKILIQSSTYWAATIPDSSNNINGYLQTSGLVFFDKTTGIISINVNKTYKVEVSCDLNYLTVSEPVTWEINLKNNTSGSLVDFSHKLYNNATQSVNYSGVSMKITGFISNCSSFTLTNRIITVNTMGITINSTAGKFDSSYTISLMEI